MNGPPLYFEWFVRLLMGVGVEFSLFYMSPSLSLYLWLRPPLSSPLSSSPSILPCSHTTTVAPSLNSSCHCWVTGGRLLRNVLLSPMAALSSTEPPLYVLPPSFCVLLSPPLHATLLSVMLWPQPLCVLSATVTGQELETVSLCNYLKKHFTLWLGWTLNGYSECKLEAILMFLPQQVHEREIL